MSAKKVSLLGAESTGKTELSHALRRHFEQQGLRVTVVAEVLREWCQREGRTPRPGEQLPIAQEQERRVDAAEADADLVIADTSALMVAIYSAMLFEDGTLYRFALQRQATYDATLVTGLDLPWVSDGLQRDGPHVREPVDALVRQALQKAGVAYQVVYGHGAARLESAVAALARMGIGSDDPQRLAASRQRPAYACEKCSDPDCERQLFGRLLGTSTMQK